MSDVVVYGATAAGVCAAVAAAEAGARVTLLEPGRHVGGMVSGGLGYTDVGDVRVIGGMAARFRAAVADHYGVPVGHYAGPEPHVAESIFCRWLAEAGVDVVLDAPLDGLRPPGAPAPARRSAGLAGPPTSSSVGPPVDLTTDDGGAPRIAAVHAGGTRYEAAVFVDASYEGDLLAAAGVPYAVGREDVARYGESLAGRREIVPGMHVMPDGISPFAADPTGRELGPLLAQVKAEPLAPVGSGDGGVMSYGYRVCLTTAPDRVPFTASPAWDTQYWELGRRLFEHWRRTGREVAAGRLLGLEPNLPGGKADGNSLGPFSLSVLDGSAWDYPDADPPERERIRLAHLHHAQDFLYFLATDDAVPAPVRAEINRWGLPADEFADTGHLPHQLYVREARRMVGEYVLTQHDLLGTGGHPDGERAEVRPEDAKGVAGACSRRRPEGMAMPGRGGSGGLRSHERSDRPEGRCEAMSEAIGPDGRPGSAAPGRTPYPNTSGSNRSRKHADAVAMGSYHIDIREVQRAWRWAYEHPDPIAHVVTEGYLSVRVPAYQIPYRCLTPRYDDCANLLVPVCVSASHVAFASVRMEPQYQMLGHVAGVAAAMAARTGAPVQRVSVGDLQGRLVDAGQVLSLRRDP